MGLSKVKAYSAVHVRRTDKAEEAWLFSAGDWTKLVAPHAAKMGGHVFVMTDDPTVYEQMKNSEEARTLGLRFYNRCAHGRRRCMIV